MAKFSQYLQDRSYRIYVTDALKGIIETAGRSKVSHRWIDGIIKPVEDTRTTEEVTNDIIAGLGKLLRKEEETE